MATDPKSYLWRNICALMGDPEPSLDAVQRRTKIGRGTVQRIKEGEAATRLSSLETIAAAFKIEVWQLLVPNLDPASPPQLAEPGLSDRLKSIEHRIDQLAGAGVSHGKQQRAA